MSKIMCTCAGSKLSYIHTHIFFPTHILLVVPSLELAYKYCEVVTWKNKHQPWGLWNPKQGRCHFWISVRYTRSFWNEWNQLLWLCNWFSCTILSPIIRLDKCLPTENAQPFQRWVPLLVPFQWRRGTGEGVGKVETEVFWQSRVRVSAFNVCRAFQAGCLWCSDNRCVLDG